VHASDAVLDIDKLTCTTGRGRWGSAIQCVKISSQAVEQASYRLELMFDLMQPQHCGLVTAAPTALL
jgi:hypothetical protein